MCGISGIVGPRGSKYITRERLDVMNRVLEHRGPDEDGLYLTPDENPCRAGLAHRRLSIIDLAGGHQPMADDSGRWITYNGEIYNHRELRSELESSGHRYRTRSDTETILHAYEQYGEACLERFRGMFAFALWDGQRNCLFAARDRLGIKPLYYAQHDGHFIFASEIKAILASGLVPAVINRRALPEFFVFGQTADDSTLFEGIYKLMPGHWLGYDGKRLTIQRYWDWRFQEPASYQSDESYLHRFAALLEESVRIHLMSDVPLGTLLSGGLDSSLIAAMAAKHSAEPLHTFTVGYEANYYSELSFAREVARCIGSNHHEVVITPDDFFKALPELIWQEDEPLKFTSSVPLYFVSKLAKEHVKTVLSGEGSDELFAGYNDRYWAVMLNDKLARAGGRYLPEALRKRVRHVLWELPLPLRIKKAISHTILYHSPTLEGMMFDNFYSCFTREMQEELLLPAFKEAIDGEDPYENAVKLVNQADSAQFLHRMLYADVKMYLLEILMKQDQMSMAASVETRVPFLDHRLVEFAGTVPPRLRLRGRAGKRLVKLTAERYLPQHIVHRPKAGFPVPFDDWLSDNKAEYAREILLDERTHKRGYFNLEYIAKMFRAHQSKRRDFHNQIWMLLNFELWHRIFFDNANKSSWSVMTMMGIAVGTV